MDRPAPSSWDCTDRPSMRVPRGPLVSLLAVTAIAVAGCGGSSKPSGTPAGSGGGTGTSISSALPPSTKVGSAAYRAFVARGLAQIPGVPHSAIPKIISCVIQKELSQGVTTVGAVKSHGAQVQADGVACARAAGLH